MYLKGSIVVTVRTGRRGEFSVGKFFSPIGEFEIRHAVLDQLSDGRYEGLVDVTKVEIDSYRYGNSHISKLVARVADVQIHVEGGEAQLPEDPLLNTVSDHLDTPEPPAAQAQQETSTASADDAPAEDSSPANANTGLDELKPLFGDLADAVRNRKPVQLDPAHSKFRQQVAHLKSASTSYRYKGTDSTWHPIEAYPD